MDHIQFPQVVVWLTTSIIMLLGYLSHTPNSPYYPPPVDDIWFPRVVVWLRTSIIMLLGYLLHPPNSSYFPLLQWTTFGSLGRGVVDDEYHQAAGLLISSP